MTGLSHSFRKVDYQLRPRKQVERRMLIDAFQRLATAGFPIPDYQYTGMGSIYFVDFVLFHKFLGISQMVSVEASEKAVKRVRFNQPFECIEIRLGLIGEVIPELSADRKHILWLDYDTVINKDIIQDVLLASARLSAGSLLLVTVDVEPPVEGGKPSDWLYEYRNEAPEFTGALTVEMCTRSRLPSLNAQILGKAIDAGLDGREAKFAPLFNFEYADGHRMLTVGGMIVTKAETRLLDRSSLDDIRYVRRNLDDAPYQIRVPRVTRKERVYLDSKMPCVDGWTPEEFEFTVEEAEEYRDIYRFFPAYAELML